MYATSTQYNITCTNFKSQLLARTIPSSSTPGMPKIIPAPRIRSELRNGEDGGSEDWNGHF